MVGGGLLAWIEVHSSGSSQGGQIGQEQERAGKEQASPVLHKEGTTTQRGRERQQVLPGRTKKKKKQKKQRLPIGASWCNDGQCMPG